MKFRFGYACMMIVAFGPACSNHPTSAPPDFRITIQEFHFAEGGQRLDYEVVPSAVRVKYTEDFNSKKSILIWETNLVSEQRAELATAVTRLNLSTLKDNYDSGGFDGVQISFEFIIGQSKPRNVHIGNTNQAELQEFVHNVNRFIQNAQYRIRENWEDDGEEGDDDTTTQESPTSQKSDEDMNP